MNETIGLDIRDQYTMVIVRTFSGFFALAGSIYVISNIIFKKRLFFLNIRLVFYLSMMSICESTIHMFTYDIWNGAQKGEFSTNLCLAQAMIMQFSQVAEFGWITVIAVNLYREVKRLRTEEWVYHLIVWSFASLCTGLPIIKKGAYGFTGLWCWLTTDGVVFRLLLFYIPLFIFWVVVLSLSYKIRSVANVKLKDMLKSVDSKRHIRSKIRFSMSYPAVFIILYFFPLLNRVYSIFGNNNIFIVTLLQTFTAPLLGFANGIIYWLNEKKHLSSIEYDQYN